MSNLRGRSDQPLGRSVPSEKRLVAPDALRVFLSSRMEELAPERAAVRAALEAEGVLAWAFETDAGARPSSARQTYLEELAVSDVYVSIFWKGYGAYTVDEFDAAGASELPRLVYEKTTEAADREPKLQAFLDEVGDVERGVTIRRFATPTELGELVADDIRRLRSKLKRIWGTKGKAYTLTPNGARFDRTARMTPIRRESQDITDCLARPDHFIDRVDALNRVREAIASGETMVGYVGEPGIGKTAVMRSVAHDRRWTAVRFPDGVGICAPGDTDLHLADLLRTLWAFFYRVSDRTYVPDDVEVRRNLVGKKALIFIDDIALPPDQVEQLGGLLPKSVFVVTAGGPASDGNDPLSFVKAVPLEGFDDPEDMVELFSAVYRRPVVGPAREDVARLCIAAGGSPGRITRLANEAWGSGAPFDEWLVERSARGGEPISQSLTRRVTPEQRRLLLILAAFGADLTTPEDVVSRLGVDADTVQAVVGSGDIEEDGPRYRLPGAVYLATSDLGDAKALRGDIFEATVEWVGEASREEVGENRVFIQRVLEWGAKNESRRGVLVLARVVEEPLALTGTWGSWGTVLDLAVAAASAEQDDDTRAWALHQRGTRALMLGDRRTARRDLRAAYLLYQKRGETGPAALSRHNLRQGPRAFPLPRGSALTTFVAIALTLVAVVAAAAVIGGLLDGVGDNGGITTEPVTTIEPGISTEPVTTIEPGISTEPAAELTITTGSEVNFDEVFATQVGEGRIGLEASHGDFSINEFEQGEILFVPEPECASLLSGQQCGATVRWFPSAPGTLDETIMIGGIAPLVLIGEAISPLAFEPQEQELSLSVEKPVAGFAAELINISDAPVDISAVEGYGDFANATIDTQRCPSIFGEGILDAGESCFILVTADFSNALPGAILDGGIRVFYGATNIDARAVVSFAGLSVPVWTRPVPMQGIWWEIARRSFTVEWEAVPFASAYGLEASICWDGESNCDQLSGPQIVSSPFGSVFLPLDPAPLDAKYQLAKDAGLTPVVVLTAYAIGTDAAGAEITSERSETRHEVTDGPFEMFGVTYDPALGSSLECGKESLSLTVAIQSFLLDPGELTVSTWDGGSEQDTRDEVTAVVSPTATESLAEVSFIPSDNSTLDRIDFLLDSVVGATENVDFPVSGCIK